MINHFGAVSAH